MRKRTKKPIIQKKIKNSNSILRSHFNKFVNSNIVGLLIATPDGKVIETNDYYLRLIDYSRDEFKKGLINWRTITPPEWLQADENAIRELREKGVCKSYEKEYQRRDGTRVWISLTNVMLGGPEERIAAFVIDITDRKNVEQELQRTKETFQLFIEHSPAAIAMFDTEMRYLVASRRFLQDYHLNLEGKDIIGKSHYEIFPEIPENIKEVHRRCMAGAIEESQEDAFQRSDGSIDWVRWESRPWYDSLGKIGGLILFSEVITEFKNSQIALEKSAERFRMIFENSLDGLFLAEKEGKILLVNPAGCRIFGRSEKEIRSLGRKGIVDTTDPRLAAGLETREKTGQFSNELTGIYADGKKFPIEAKSTFFTDKHNKELAVTIIRDISERKQMEKQLLESEERFHMLFEEAPLGYQSLNEEGNFIEVNKAWLETLGYSREEVIGKWFGNFLSPEYIGVFKERFPFFKSQGRIYSEFYMINKNGEKHYIAFDGRVGHNPDGSFKQTHCILKDETERKIADIKIKNLNRIYNVLSEINKAIIHIKDQQKLFEEACRIAVQTGEFMLCWIGLIDDKSQRIIPAAQYGASEGYLDNIYISTSCNKQEGCGPTGAAIREGIYIICNDIEKDERMLPWREEALKRGFRSSAVFPVTMGGAVYGEINFYSAQPDFFTGEEIKLLEELSSDISFGINSIAQEKQKQKAENERDRFFNRSIDMMAGFGLDGYFRQLNPAWSKTLGWTNDELSAKPFIEFVHPDDYEPTIKRINKLKEGGQPQFNFLNRCLCRDGSYKWLSWNSVPFIEEGIIFVVARDVTLLIKNEDERKKLEAQLTQAQKLESLGTLAGGIAHDFNNILNIIIGYASLLQMHDADKDEVFKSIKIILNESMRGAELIKQLLTFARKNESIFQPVQINDIITEIKQLLGETFPKTIEINTDLQKDLPVIIADHTQIHQVFLNLCINARDAMPEGGKLSIYAKEIPADAIKNQNLSDDKEYFIHIQVKDTGTGIDETIRQRIFEPFFTTKQVGKGTGLGLALVYGIVKNHGGYIDIDTEVGKGTAFNIYLPAQKSVAEIYEQSKKITENDIFYEGKGTILLIEDEKSYNELLTSILVSKGYKVISAHDGMQGLMAYQNHIGEITVVILDLGLPRLGGDEVYRQIKKVNSKAKIILMSGFIDPEIKARLLDSGIRHIIHKPFTPDKILQVIRDEIEN